MFRPRAFLRRRKSTSTAEATTEPYTYDSVEPSALSCVEGSQYRPFEAAARKKGLAPLEHERRGHSTTGTTSDSTLDRDKAHSITQSMSKKWFGVEEVSENLDFLPSSSSGARIQTWVEHHSAFQTDPSFTHDARLSMHSNIPTAIGADTPKPSVEEDKVSKLTERWVWMAFLVQWMLMVVIILICCLTSWRGRTHSSALSRFPFRQKFFEVLIFDDGAQRFHTEFNQGVQDAADVLRVDVNIDRTSDKREAIQNIHRARDSLYDGIMITTANDSDYMHALIRSHEDTPVLALGAFESYSNINSNRLSQVGDREVDVGRLIGKTMREQAMKTVLCVSHADNQESVHRCNGLKDVFGNLTYNLNLNTMMQSELKSKLIPIILDNTEINGLFVADSRSFGLVHQILKSLNRLCANNKSPKTSRCILLGAYGTDKNILQAIKKRELQFTIDPQEYVRGYVATALLTLQSIGYPAPTSSASTLLMSRVVNSSKDATKLLKHNLCRPRDVSGERDLSFKFFLFGKKSKSDVGQLKRGLREAARDFGVDVQFHHYLSSLNATREADFVQDQLRMSDGAAVSVGRASDVHLLNDFPFFSVWPLITYGLYSPELTISSEATLHIGYDESEIPAKAKMMSEECMEAASNSRGLDEGSVDSFDENPALQGYLSVLFLVINSMCGQLPSGLFSTGVLYPLQKTVA